VPASDSKQWPQPLLSQQVMPPMRQQNKFPQHSQQQNHPPPLMGKLIPHTRTFPNSKPAKSSYKDFKPNQVNKNKPLPSSTVPKLISYPIPQRKAIVEQTTNLVKKVDNVTADFILRADKVPSQQMAGRLELGLGSIVKEIRSKYEKSKEHGDHFKSQFLMRHMKHAIRERLRCVMLGKVVGKVDEIVKQYRMVYPPATDPEIMKIALDAQAAEDAKNLAINIEDAGSYQMHHRQFFIFPKLQTSLDILHLLIHLYVYKTQIDIKIDLC
jgi:hypothetical protein